MHKALDALGDALWRGYGTQMWQLFLDDRLTETDIPHRDLFDPDDPFPFETAYGGHCGPQPTSPFLSAPCAGAPKHALQRPHREPTPTTLFHLPTFDHRHAFCG